MKAEIVWPPEAIWLWIAYQLEYKALKKKHRRLWC